MLPPTLDLFVCSNKVWKKNCLKYLYIFFNFIMRYRRKLTKYDYVIKTLWFKKKICFTKNRIPRYTLLSLIPSNKIPRHFTREITSNLLSINKIYTLPISNPREKTFRECGIVGVCVYGLCFWGSLIKFSRLPNVCAFNYIDDHNREDNRIFVFKTLDEIVECRLICRSFIDINMECL